MGPGYYGYGSVSGGAVSHLLFGALWFVILIAVIVILVRVATHGGRRGMWMRHMMERDSALDILKERYAKGEIDKKEFDEKKKDLTV